MKMGKHSNKSKTIRRGDCVLKPDSLDVQIVGIEKSNFNKRIKYRKKRDDFDDMCIEQGVSAKILDEARKQQIEFDKETNDYQSMNSLLNNSLKSNANAEDDIESENETADSNDAQSDLGIDPADEADVEKFMSNRKEGRIDYEFNFGHPQDDVKLDIQILDLYRGVRDVLCKYRSGKLPKAFKIVPKLSNWEQILCITEPDKWTAAAMYQATRIFVSNLNAKMCQRFLNIILLPRVRDDIAEYKRLNPHLYASLRKGLFKPAAFIKGVLLPLCESGTCTLREATILGSVLRKVHLPMLHAAAALLKLAEMDYTGCTSLLIRILIDKKYTLPYRVIDGLVYHFMRFSCDKRKLPVLWHQAFLAFAQRYKQDLSTEQREALLSLLKTHFHPQIGDEIRRELTHAQSRDEEFVDMEVPDTNNPDAMSL